MTGNGSNSIWTDERTALLKHLWAKGESCTRISIIMGNNITRNAVIGRVSRLGLPKRRTTSSAPPRYHATTKKPKGLSLHGTGGRGFEFRKPNPSSSNGRTADFESANRGSSPCEGTTMLDDPPLSELITILDLAAHHCKYICHDGAWDEPRYCGRQRLSGVPYCSSHMTVTHNGIPRRREQHEQSGLWLKAMGK